MVMICPSLWVSYIFVSLSVSLSLLHPLPSTLSFLPYDSQFAIEVMQIEIIVHLAEFVLHMLASMRKIATTKVAFSFLNQHGMLQMFVDAGEIMK